MSADHYLLLDEPFSGLGINMVKEVSNTLKEITCMDDENTLTSSPP
jgi:ABC-type branched-subunit amino acid transport system ATPase component